MQWSVVLRAGPWHPSLPRGLLECEHQNPPIPTDSASVGTGLGLWDLTEQARQGSSMGNHNSKLGVGHIEGRKAK